ncbi:MAG: GWxTD domain-containing protein [bacterium]|nr:GWxTD domain-containing protein [bacterium]
MKKCLLFFIVFVIDAISSITFAENLTRMRLDSVRFQEADGSVRYEFPISIIRGRLYYQTNEKGIRYTSYRLRTRVFQNDSLIGEEVWDRVHCPQPQSITVGGYLPDLAIVTAIEGMYRIEIELTDSLGHFRDKATYPNIHFQTDTMNFTLSGLLLSNRIEPIENHKNEEFQRNGFLVIPYAEKVYGKKHPMVYLYWEQYNQKPDTLCEFTIRLLDKNQNLVYTSPKKVQLIKSDRGFHVELLPVHQFPTGTYTIMVETTVIPSNRKAKSSSRIYVHTDSIQELPEKQTFQWQPVRNYPPIAHLYYLVDSEIREQLSKLPIEEQNKWSEQFWKEQETKANSPRNVRLEDYQKRLVYVKQFDTRNKEGWETDRGRVYLMYGPPDEINDYAFQSTITSEISSEFTGGNKPYIVWKYYTLGGGVEFIFADTHLLGDFELIHSTMPGEKSDPFWWKKLKGIQ